MKFVKWILIPAVVLGVIGFVGYQFVKDYAVDKVAEEIETSVNMEEVRDVVSGIPELEAFIKEVETLPEAEQLLAEVENPAIQGNKEAEALPFHTTEEAVDVVVDRVGMPKLYDVAKRVQDGSVTTEEVIQEFSGEFSEEELMALKVIAYRELYAE